MHRVMVVAMLACSTTTDAPPKLAPGEWRCFVADPATPTLSQGNVTHLKERLIDDRFEVANVNIVHGVHSATRFTYRRAADDRYEAPYMNGVLVVKMRRADGTSSFTTFDDPDSDWWFAEDTTIDAKGMTIVSSDPHADGKTVNKTTTRFFNAPCATVDAELAKHRD